MSDIEANAHAVFDGVEVGVGTWSWGDRMFWGYRQGYEEQDIQAAFDTSLQAGLNFFDTAEVYGQGQSEKFLGSFIKKCNQPVKVATKFMPFPWRITGKALNRALKASLARLGLEKVDLYQVHFPLPLVKIETWMGAMADVCQAGLTGNIGISNFDASQTQRAYEALQHEGLRLASNQLEYHLLNRKIEKDGLLRQCQELGVKVIAYSPLAQGVLTGKYTSENPPRGFRGRKYNRKYMQEIKPLIVILKKIGSDHGSKSAGQVALNWCICKGTLPIPGAKTLQQAEQNAGAAGWRLSEAEMILLDETSDQVLKDI
jgi:aryl-alcohol dehydrogenase-like predicted oxidoreductase